MTLRARAEYPFSAVVGQDELKLALLLSAVDPTIGGVLIKGERGTAKTTIARGLAALLPSREDGAAAPFVELPLGATEDRVVGSIDVTKALREGHTQLRSGVLARANGGVLYVDEVNLLPDHLVDLLLDAAASGWVTVERDGVSAGEAARFVLVGTMNPEEGDLRPQFLDRFGLSVQVRGLDSQELRMAAVGKRLEFDANPQSVIAQARGSEDALRLAIAAARTRLPSLEVTQSLLSVVTAICSDELLDGIRGDLAIIKTARALAAWEKAAEISNDHIHRAAAFALPHRMRRRPVGASRNARSGPAASRGSGADRPGRDASAGRVADADRGAAGAAGPADAGPSGTRSAARSIDALQTQPAVVRSQQPISLVTDLIDPESSGRRGSGSTGSRRAIRATPYDQTGTLAVNESVTSAAVRGRRLNDGGVSLSPGDLMQHARSGPGRSHVLFLVDASASMATQRRLALAKAVALDLLRSNYQHRDQVALMTFRGEGAQLVMPFTSDIDAVEQALGDVPTGGRTPLAHALMDAAEILQTRKQPLVVLLTDGRANVSISDGGDPWIESLAACTNLKDACAGAVVIDCEPGPILLGRPRKLAAALGAECVALDSIDSGALTIRILRRIEAFQ